MGCLIYPLLFVLALIVLGVLMLLAYLAFGPLGIFLLGLALMIHHAWEQAGVAKSTQRRSLWAGLAALALVWLLGDSDDDSTG